MRAEAEGVAVAAYSPGPAALADRLLRLLGGEGEVSRRYPLRGSAQGRVEGGEEALEPRAGHVGAFRVAESAGARRGRLRLVAFDGQVPGRVELSAPGPDEAEVAGYLRLGYGAGLVGSHGSPVLELAFLVIDYDRALFGARYAIDPAAEDDASGDVRVLELELPLYGGYLQAREALGLRAEEKGEVALEPASVYLEDDRDEGPPRPGQGGEGVVQAGSEEAAVIVQALGPVAAVLVLDAREEEG